MRVYKYLFTLLCVVAVVACADDKSDSAMSVESSTIEIDAVGGVKSLKVDIADNWIVSTDNAWITVSPANGAGAATCEFKIDSALTVEPRYGVVRIQNLRTMQSQEIAITQQGFPYTIELEDNAFDVECYKTSEERYFDVKVRSNVEFDVNIPSDIDLPSLSLSGTGLPFSSTTSSISGSPVSSLMISFSSVTFVYIYT